MYIPTPDILMDNESPLFHSKILKTAVASTHHATLPSVLRKRKREEFISMPSHSCCTPICSTDVSPKHSKAGILKDDTPKGLFADEYPHRLSVNALSPKRARHSSLLKPRTPSANLSHGMSAMVGSIDVLRGCHVCHRRPTTKVTLSAYGACQACGNRTCFICMRICERRCLQQTVCSRCCVEEGVEGRITCLNCLESSETQDIREKRG